MSDLPNASTRRVRPDGPEAAEAGANRRQQSRSSMIVPGWLLLLESEAGTPDLRRISTRDVSEGGARVVSMEPIPTEQPWFIRFSSQGIDTKFIECAVRRVDEEVVSTLSRGEMRRYYYGVQFVRLFDLTNLPDETVRDNVQKLLRQVAESGGGPAIAAQAAVE